MSNDRMCTMVLKKGAKPGFGFHEKSLVVMLLVFIVLGSWGLGHRSYLADEMQHSALPVFMYDFLGYYSDNPGIGIDGIKSYGLAYHSHYHVFTSIIHHPPLIRLPIILNFFALGLNEFSARIVSVFFGALGLIFTYLLAELVTGSKKTSLVAAMLLALIPVYFEYSRLVMLEIPLLAMCAMVTYFFYKYVLEEKGRDAFLFGISLGLCLLTKNYGVVIIPPLVIYALASRKFNLFKDKRMYMALIIAAAIAGPWYAFAAVVPGMVGIPYSLSGHYTNYIVFSLSALAQLPGFFIEQFSFAMGILSAATVIFAACRRDRDDYLLLSWALFFYVFFLFFVDPSSSAGNFNRFVMPALPAFAILDAKYLLKLVGHPKLKKYGTVIVAAFMIASLSLAAIHVAGSEIRYPIEEAAVWVLGNTPREGGVIYTDYSQIFYFLKNDRDLSVRVGEGRTLEALGLLLNSTHASSRHESLGIENPTYYHLLLRYPLRDKLASRTDFIEYIENGPCFFPEKVFGDDRRVVVYGIREGCR